jgi:hypothetical protein
VLDEAGWLKALKLDGFEPRPAEPMILQGILFLYLDAL